MSILSKISYILVLLVAFKAIMGFHFPWEKCSCCGKRLDKNHVPTSKFRNDINQINKELDDMIEEEKRTKQERIKPKCGGH